MEVRGVVVESSRPRPRCPRRNAGPFGRRRLLVQLGRAERLPLPIGSVAAEDAGTDSRSCSTAPCTFRIPATSQKSTVFQNSVRFRSVFFASGLSYRDCLLSPLPRGIVR